MFKKEIKVSPAQNRILIAHDIPLPMEFSSHAGVVAMPFLQTFPELGRQNLGIAGDFLLPWVTSTRETLGARGLEEGITILSHLHIFSIVKNQWVEQG